MSTNTKNSVLVVDDESSNIMALTHILSGDYVVLASKSGANAIEAAKKHVPNLILLDVMMPEMDGFAVLAALRDSEPTKNIPVIFVTGLSNSEDIERALSAGAVDYIAKPFSSVLVKRRVLSQMQIINQSRLINEQSGEMQTSADTILSAVQKLRGPDASEQWDACLAEIDSSARRLLEIIKGVV